MVNGLKWAANHLRSWPCGPIIASNPAMSSIEYPAASAFIRYARCSGDLAPASISDSRSRSPGLSPASFPAARWSIASVRIGWSPPAPASIRRSAWVRPPPVIAQLRARPAMSHIAVLKLTLFALARVCASVRTSMPCIPAWCASCIASPS